MTRSPDELPDDATRRLPQTPGSPGAPVPPKHQFSGDDQPTTQFPVARPGRLPHVGTPADDAATTKLPVSRPGDARAAEPIAPISPGGGGGGTVPPSRGTGSGGGGEGGGKGPGRKPRSRKKLIRNLIIAFVAIFMVLPTVAFGIAYVLVDVPGPGKIPIQQAANITYTDGSTMTKFVPPMGNRIEVKLAQVPVETQHAVLAAEDRDFYSNPGFSVSGFARAARDNILGRENAGGGSTITQQYVKNTLVGNQHSYLRKLKELVVSTKMANEWSKDQILEGYLNVIYFGRGTYGIGAAAKAYFNKSVEQLTVPEGALLAAIIQRPSALDPDTNRRGAEARWNYVLDGMVSKKWLTPEQRAAATFPTVVDMRTGEDDVDKGPIGLVKTKVLNELADAGISDTTLSTAGLTITTTLDKQAQDAAIKAVTTTMDGQPSNLHAADVSIDPKTGGVRAYVGGTSGSGLDYASAPLQTGSAFKVFGLVANLEAGIPLSKTYDSSTLNANGITISNADGESCGVCTIARALVMSLNTSFYRMEMALPNGPAKIADVAHRAGIPETIPGVGKTLTEPDDAGPNNGIVLGQYDVRPIDMASAYATLAASGIYHKPYFVQKVVTADGEVLLDRGNPSGTRKIDANVANNVISAMKPIAAYSNGHALAGGRQSAAKTGTTQLGDTGNNKDGWMVGFTPSLSTAVWVGTGQNLKAVNASGSPLYGSGLPSDIWKKTMDGALDGTANETFPKPGEIGGQAGADDLTTTTVPPTTTTTVPRIAPPVITTTQVEILPGIVVPVPGLGPAPQPPAGQTTGQTTTGQTTGGRTTAGQTTTGQTTTGTGTTTGRTTGQTTGTGTATGTGTTRGTTGVVGGGG